LTYFPNRLADVIDDLFGAGHRFIAGTDYGLRNRNSFITRFVAGDLLLFENDFAARSHDGTILVRKILHNRLTRLVKRCAAVTGIGRIRFQPNQAQAQGK